MTLNTRQKIQKKDIQTTLESINKVGFDNALVAALEGSITHLIKDPTSPIAITYYSWSVNLLEDSRNAKQNIDFDKFLLLSSFYRILAHKVYWKQIRAGNTGYIKDFIQIVQNK